jgi:phosphoribosyl 1,2-cyclic phosphodiesterase
MIHCCSLQSGSNGNAIYVESDGIRLLFDAGISGKRARERLLLHGRDIRETCGVILSHDHTDHVACAGVYQRKFGLPIYATEKTLSVCRSQLGKIDRIHLFRSGEALDFGPVHIETVRTPHDSADGVGFVIEAGKKRLGILTDLGHVFAELPEILPTLDAVILESNHDEKMLLGGSYPRQLKARIRGPQGHISNLESAHLVAECGKRLRWVALAHLSEENNHPHLALETHRTTWGNHIPLHLAGRDGVSEMWEI